MSERSSFSSSSDSYGTSDADYTNNELFIEDSSSKAGLFGYKRWSRVRWAMVILIPFVSIIILLLILALIFRSNDKDKSDDVITDYSSSSSGGDNPIGTVSSSAGSAPPFYRTCDLSTVPSDVTYYRLPATVIPSFYSIVEQIDMDNLQFSGSVEILISLTVPTQSIWLHAGNNLIITELPTVLDISTANVLTASAACFYSNNSFLVLQFPSLIPAQEEFLTIKFSAPLSSTTSTGLYAVPYIAPDAPTVTKYMAATQFEPYGARRAFPCFDEPGLKSTYDVSIITQRTYSTVLSNMPSILTTTIDDTWYRNDYATSSIMSTYLLAFAIANFNYTSGITSTGVLVRSWAPPSLVQTTSLATIVGIKNLDKFGIYYSQPYPLPKEDQIDVPNKGGAMENWGLVTYSPATLLYNETQNTERDKVRVVSVVAHELAHQWFGNLITCAWWSDIFVNEGYATYVSYQGVDDAVPDWNHWESFQTDSMQGAFIADSGTSINNSVIRYPDGSFDTITYDKGASIIRMWNGWMGEDEFQRAHQTYLNQYQYTPVTAAQLIAVLDQFATPFSVTDYSREWLYYAGFPLVRVSAIELSLGIYNWSLTQERFFFTRPITPSSTVWKILVDAQAVDSSDHVTPISVSSQWLLQPSGQNLFFDNGYEYLKLNIQQFGFYRVLYPDYMYDKFVRHLMLARSLSPMTVEDRVSLIDDAFNIAQAGYTDYSNAVDLTRTLVYETSLPVWLTAIKNFDNIFNIIRYAYNTPSALNLFQQFYNNITDSIYRNLTYASSTHQSNILTEILSLAALRYNQSAAITSLSLIYTTTTPLTVWPDIRESVLSAGVITDTGNAFNNLLSVYNTATALDNQRILRSLSRTTDPTQILQLLGLILTSPLTDVLKRLVLTTIAGNTQVIAIPGQPSGGQYLVWQWLANLDSNNWDKIPQQSIEQLTVLISDAGIESTFGPRIRDNAPSWAVAEFRTYYPTAEVRISYMQNTWPTIAPILNTFLM